jgi:hypothetical protein
MGSPSKRPRIFSDDDDDEGNEQQTVSDPFAKVHATTRGAALNRELFSLKAQLKDVQTENRALLQAVGFCLCRRGVH